MKAEYDGKEMKLFIDDELKVEKSYAKNLKYSQYPVNVGRDYWKNTDQHLGWISNCAIDELVISGKINNENEILLNLPFDETSDAGNFVFYGASSFICDGVIFYDRTPQSELFQMKKSQSPIKFEMMNDKIVITNRYSFTDLNEIDFKWFLYSDGNLLKNGELEVECSALSSTTIKSPVDEIILASIGEYILELTANVREPKPWASKGDEITFEQFVLSKSTFNEKSLSKDGEINLKEISNELLIYSKKNDFRINKKTGELIISKDSEEIISGPELNVWRAPISNERVDWGQAEAKDWYETGLNRLILDSTNFNFIKETGYVNCFVKQFYRLPENEDYIINQFEYTIYSSGRY